VDEKLLSVALGHEPADLAVVNGQIVNVFSGEVYAGGVAIAGERIAAVGDVEYAIGEKTTLIDAAGSYIVPGFVEPHMHPEMSNLSVHRFAEVTLCHGTTSVFTDYHEIGVVGGVDAIEAALQEARQTGLKIHWVVPSHVPFSVDLETSGGRMNSGSIAPLMEREDTVGLSEVLGLQIAMGNPDLRKSIDAARRNRKVLAGHGGDEMTGPMWNAFAAAGVRNDHEALNLEGVVQRLRTGVYALLRHNIFVETLPELIRALTERKLNTRLMCLTTDGDTVIGLVRNGHMDHLVRLAISLGADYVTAIQMATLNPACAYQMEDRIGALAPGRYADINIVTGPEHLQVLKTIASGKLVAEAGKTIEPVQDPEHNPIMLNTFHLKAPVKPADLVFQAPDGAQEARVHVMRTLPWIPLTEGEETVLPVKDGYLHCDLDKDLLHIAVVERHHKTGNIGRAFIGGFGMKRGALATSEGHDHHNIVVMGVDPADMAIAANRVAELQGGIVLVEAGRVCAEIAQPLFGLMADVDAWTLADQRQAILDRTAQWGCTVAEPIEFLVFITLAAFPWFSITDKGYVDVKRQALMDPVLEWRTPGNA
jgi:adenine deaminase